MTSKIETATAAAAEQVAGNPYLLEEILVHLPPKSVTRSKLVSKQWLSQISDAQFLHRHSHKKFHTGMFVTDEYRNCRFADFVSFTDELNPAHQTIPSLGFLYDGIEPPVSEIQIINSCNGLFLCSVSWNSQPFDYCVCNPTTKTFRLLDINRNPVQASPEATACLAFDPSASFHYKVICTSTTTSFESCVKFYLYSSEDQSWKTIACPYVLTPYTKGSFLNGSIYYWLNGGRTSLCFDLYNEVMKQIVLSHVTGPSSKFLDAFGNHLYLLNQNRTSSDLRVCQMSSGFSQWVTKYNPSVARVCEMSSGILVTKNNPSVAPILVPFSMRGSYCFIGVTIVKGAEEDESQLVLGIPGKLVLYNLKEDTVKEIYNLRGLLDGLWGYIGVEAFQFVETLSVV